MMFQTPTKIRSPFLAIPLLLLCVQSLHAQETSLARQVIRWLDTTCGVASETESALTLAELGRDAVPLFIDAFDRGPTPETLLVIRTGAERRFEDISRLLNDGRTFGLTPADLTALRETERVSFVRQAVEDFRFSYEDAALRAVQVLGSPAGRDFLERVAGDASSPHAETARQLLAER